MRILGTIVLLFVLAASVAANSIVQESGSRVIEIEHESSLMDRKMRLRVLLPRTYEQGMERFPVLILLHGLGGDFRNWIDKTRLSDKTESLKLIVVTPDGGNGWYADSVSDAKDAYQSYLIKELIPFVDSRFRTVGSKDSRFIAGLSMGGYGAIKFGLKFPELFSVVGSFSGALDAPTIGAENAILRPTISKVFGTEDNEKRKSENIFLISDSITSKEVAKLPFFYLDCGTEDWLIGTNREFSRTLITKKIPHEFRQLPGRHDWKFWDSQIGYFLRLLVDRGAVIEAGSIINSPKGV